MHAIIGDKNCIGSKAARLIELDELGLTSNFVAVASDVDPIDIKDELMERLHLLEITNPIIRSSCMCEDSDKHSYAGIFRSVICEQQRILQAINDVKNSIYDKKVATYCTQNGLPMPDDIGIIIQQYIEPDAGGVIFNSKSRDLAYGEFSYGSSESVQMGKDIGYSFGIRKGIIFLSDRPTEYHDWLKALPIVTEQTKCFAISEADIEFVVQDDRLYVVQIRPLTSWFVDASMYMFRKRRITHFLPSDVSLEHLNGFFEKLDFSLSLKRLICTNEILKIGIDDYINLIDELTLRSMDKKSVSSFIKKIDKYNHRMLTLSARLLEAKKCLIEYKKYNINMYLIDHIIMLMIDVLSNKMREDGLDPYDPRFCKPHKLSLTSKQIIDGLVGESDSNLCDELMYKLRERMRCGPDDACVVPDLAVNLQKLIWMHDSNNYYIDIITKRFGSNFNSRTGLDIQVLCRASFDEIISCELEKIVVSETPKEEQVPVKFSWPLRGRVACKGDFEGVAKVLEMNQGHDTITEEDVIITHETTPSLIVPMVKCAGIITQAGGLTSHAAIVSREIGKPCIVGVKGCLDAIKDGERIRVCNGMVHKIKK